MKRFTAFFLAFAFCLCFFVPSSARAAEFTATYTTDIGIQNYKYCFIASNNGSYVLYLVNENENTSFSSGLQFYATSSATNSCINIRNSDLSTSMYDVSYSNYNSETGYFGSVSNIRTVSEKGFAFFGQSSGKVILASNCDIYDQDNVLLVSGNYSNFLSYFSNPEFVQQHVTDYTHHEEPTTTTTTAGESGGGSGSLLDLSGLFDSITSLGNTFTNLITPIQLKLADIYDVLVQIKNIVNERIYLKIIHINELQREVEKVTDKLDSLISAFGTLDTGISGITDNLDDINDDIQNKLDSISSDIINKLDSIQVNELTSIKDTLTVIKVNFVSFVNGWASKLDNISYDIISKLNSIQSGELTAISSKLNALSSGFQSVVSAINGIPNSIQNLLEYLFVPTNNTYYQEIIDIINEKFGFVNQIIALGDVLVDNSNSFTNTPPSFRITFDNHKYFGNLSFELIDFSKLANYIDYIKAITSGITLYFFIRRTRRRLPEIISGGGS